MSVEHKLAALNKRHPPHNWEYADQTAREAATGFTSADLYKYARQTDDNSVWMLTATTPTWIYVGSGARQILKDGSVAFTADQSMGSHKLTSVTDPSSAQDAATKAYVDAAVAGNRDFKDSVRVATTADITLSGTQTIDGVSVVAGNRVLVKNQSTAADNGIYVCASGSWSRSTDADASAEVTAGMVLPVTEGTTNGDKLFMLTTNDTITLGSTALTFSAYGSTTIDSDIEILIDGAGATITTGVKFDIQIDFDCTIISATLLADQSGSIVVDIFKCTYSQYDAGATHPVSGDKITASAPPTISTATKSTDSTLTGWTTAISANDILRFNVNSATTIQRVSLILKIRRG